MSLVTKKKWYLDYLLIIVGTGLMALAINSVFDASGLAYQHYLEYPAVSSGM